MSDTRPASVTIHLRVPIDLKELIDRRAEMERRQWTQMAIIMLEDAAADWKKRSPKKRM